MDRELDESGTTRVGKERWFGLESLKAEGMRRLQDVRRAISDPNLILDACECIYCLLRWFEIRS